MDHDEARALFDRQRSTPPRAERTAGVVRMVAERGGWDGIVHSALEETTADAAIAEQVAYFSALGREFEWKLYAHDRPADLGDRLLAAGFAPEPEETVMVAPVAGQFTGPGPDVPEGIEIREVTDNAGVDLVLGAHEEAFGSPAGSLGPYLCERLARAPETMVLLVALAGDRPVSGARLELDPGVEFAGLWGGGTAPDWRGRGIYRALVAHRARVADARGYRLLQVDASSESRPILHRLGFAAIATTTPYIWRP
jgi:GNAT superfamily N-acetyltransferase